MSLDAQETVIKIPAETDHTIDDVYETINALVEENRKELNKIVASYEGLTKLILYPTEFEKTPKKSIKRYLYTNIQV